MRDICDECYKKQEDDYQKVATFLRDQPGTTIQELSDETGVTVAQIRHFILIGRILVSDFPNLSYSCEICGKKIKVGRICTSCKDSISQSTGHEEKDENGQSQDRNRIDGGYISKYL
jgi:uncharacterized protein